MKKIDLGQLVQTLANVGVIAGIVFLGIELQQNNSLLAAQTRANQLAQQTGFIERSSDPQFMEIVDRYAAGHELSSSQIYLLAGLANHALALWQWQYIEYQAGMLAREQLPVGVMRAWYDGNTMLPAPVREMWQLRSGAFNDDFVDFMEQNVINRDD